MMQHIKNAMLLVFVLSIATGCSSMKTASVVSTAGATGAVVGSVTSGGILAPAIGAGLASGGSAIFMDWVTPDEKPHPPPNIFSVLQTLISVAGWGAILAFFVIPAIFGWLLPGPLKLKGVGKKK